MSEVCSEHEYYMLAVTLHHLSNFSQNQLSNGKKLMFVPVYVFLILSL